MRSCESSSNLVTIAAFTSTSCAVFSNLKQIDERYC
jgi:hypothetical protein